jgi:nicotinamide mononucleotide transporter
MNWIEAVAVVFGIVCVALTVRQSIWCWPAGLLQVTLYVYVFYGARLYSDMILHVIYIGVQIYGWHHWLHGEQRFPSGSGVRASLPVTMLGVRERWLWGIAVVFVALGWGGIMDRYTDAAAAHADAFIAAASLCAQYLMAQKKIENWIVWIVVDLVAIAVYWTRDLQLTAGLYVVFLLLCIAGVRSWYQSLVRTRKASEEIADTA